MRRATIALTALTMLAYAAGAWAEEAAKPADVDLAVKKLIADGGDLYALGQFKKASARADEALKLKPDSSAAKQLKEMCAEGLKAKAARMPTEGERDRQAIVEGVIRDMAAPREALRRSEKRDEATAAAGTTTESREIESRLDGTTISVDFNALSLKEAAAFVSTAGKVNIQVDPRARVGDKSAPDAEVTFKAQNIKLRNVVTWLARLNNLSWTVRDQVVFITDAEHLEEMKVTVVYDIRDLVAPIPDYSSAPQFDMTLPAVNARRISEGFYRVPWWWQNRGAGVFTGAYFADFEETQRQFITEDEVLKLVEELLDAEDAGRK